MGGRDRFQFTGAKRVRTITLAWRLSLRREKQTARSLYYNILGWLSMWGRWTIDGRPYSSSSIFYRLSSVGRDLKHHQGVLREEDGAPQRLVGPDGVQYHVSERHAYPVGQNNE